MTRDDIIRWAKESGLASSSWVPDAEDEPVLKELTRFANFAALYERNQCAQVAKLVACEIDDTNGTATYIAKAIQARGDP